MTIRKLADSVSEQNQTTTPESSFVDEWERKVRSNTVVPGLFAPGALSNVASEVSCCGNHCSGGHSHACGTVGGVPYTRFTFTPKALRAVTLASEKRGSTCI